MTKNQKDQYYENVPHITNSSPYSIHKSSFASGDGAALYHHWHPDFEFFYLEEGTLYFYIEDVPVLLTAGEAVFMPPNLLHRADCVPGGGGIFRALVFSPDFMAASMSTAQFQKYVHPVLHNNMKFMLHLKPDVDWQKGILSDLVRILQSEEKETGKQEVGPIGKEMAKPEGGAGELLTAGLVLAIWQALYNGHISLRDENTANTKLEQQLQEAMSFIRENYSEDITLKSLARLAHMSEGQFCRAFRQLTDTTPFTYLKKYRIMCSCAYLSGSDRKISEICTLCGFSNISYYNREFLKLMRTTPSSYRKQCRNESYYM